jgi:ABC-2 type transport system ATP-binding protein
VGWALDFTIGFFGGLSQRKHDVVARLGLEPLMHRPIGALSKGQRKRTALALGLLTPQPALLADEPFEGLDLRQTRDVGAALREHAASGRTLFLSIHQISDAARVCDRFVLLSGGCARGEGTFDDLASLAGATAAHTPADLEDVVLALT